MISTDFINNHAITVIFSKDRPLQLDLCLYSNRAKSRDWDFQKQVVLYSSSNAEYEDAYKKLSSRYKSIEFIREKNFKKDLLTILDDKSYIFFIVDDCIFTRDYSLSTTIYALSISPNLLGFSFRLGENTTECYPIWQKNFVPQLLRISDNPRFDDMICFDWTKVSQGDFGYPLELSSSLYRHGNIKEILEECKYDSPNSLEWDMACNLQNVSYMPLLASYRTSVAFCNPLNKVQKENNNRFGGKEEYSTTALLKRFQKQERICYDPLEGFVSNGCHQEVDISFYESEGN